MIKINLYNNNRLHLKCKQHDIHLEAISKKKILFKKSKFAALVPFRRVISESRNPDCKAFVYQFGPWNNKELHIRGPQRM